MRAFLFFLLPISTIWKCHWWFWFDGCMNNENEKQFISPDFYISAFILAKGLRLSGVTKDSQNPRRLLFIFEDKESAQKLAEDFIFGRDLIEPKRYSTAIKELKDLIHSQI